MNVTCKTDNWFPFQIREQCRELVLTDFQIKQLMDRLLEDVEMGLRKDTHLKSIVKCFVTYVQDLPNGKGKTVINYHTGNLFYVGYIFKMLFFLFSREREIFGSWSWWDKFQSPDYRIGGGKLFHAVQNICNSAKYHAWDWHSSKLKYILGRNWCSISGCGEANTRFNLQLFDHIAECLASFMKEHKVGGERLPLGFTFSFPCTQKGLTKGILERWTKGFNCSGVVGEDVVQMLKDALARRNVSNFFISNMFSGYV